MFEFLSRCGQHVEFDCISSPIIAFSSTLLQYFFLSGGTSVVLSLDSFMTLTMKDHWLDSETDNADAQADLRLCSRSGNKVRGSFHLCTRYR